MTVALATIVVGNLSAQSSQPIVLDLAKSLEIALSENPTIKVADLEIERQDWVRKETVGNLLPSVTATGSYQRSIVKQEMAKGLSFGADNTFTANGSLTLPLFAPTVYKTLQLNRTQMESAVEAARASKVTLAAEVKKAYFNILLAEQSLEVLRSSESSIARTVENTRTMYNQGLVSEYDLLSAEVQLSNLKPTIMQTEQSIVTAKMMFRMYLGLPAEQEFTLTGELNDYAEQIMAGGETLYADLSDNTDLRSLEIQMQMLQDQLELYQSQRLPTIAATGSAMITGNDMERPDFSAMMGGGATGGTTGGTTGGATGGTTTTPAPAKNSFWWQHPISAGVSISIPLFSGMKNHNRAKQARNSIEQLSLQRDYLEQSVNLQMQNAINTTLTARESLLATDVTVRQAEKAYSIAQTSYTAGGITILELNQSELALTQARLNYSQAIYNYLSALAEYNRVAGRTE